MAFERGRGGADPIRAGSGSVQEERRLVRSSVLATGTLACPRCDAPVAPPGPMSPAEPLGCPYCAHARAVRDFLSLTPPSRPARVQIRVVQRAPR
jgi:hypothetical protein